MKMENCSYLPVSKIYTLYADTVIDSVKIAGKTVDAASDVAKGIDTAIDAADTVHDTAKTADIIDEVADTVKTVDTVDEISDTVKTVDAVDEITDTVKISDEITDTAKAADVVDDTVDTVKEISKIPFEELPEKVQQSYKTYADCDWNAKKALENFADGTDAGRRFYNRDNVLPIYDSNGSELIYHEFDAYSLGDDPEFDPEKPWLRGFCRFVRDNLGNTYYTEDHYDTLRLIDKAIKE